MEDSIFDELEECIKRNIKKLKKFKERNITSFSESDEKNIEILFNDFMDALKIASGKKLGTRSPVATAKALHLLAPKFFPLWDNKIAKAYGCSYKNEPTLYHNFYHS